MSFLFHDFKNYINRDPLSDWFDINDDKYKKDTPNKFKLKIQEEKEIFKNKMIENFKNDKNFYQDLNHKEIIQKINKNEKFIIYHGNLYHKQYNTYIKPDLIIHKDLFLKYCPEIKFELPEYLIIDILFKILHFNSEQTDILNQGNIYYHKCKMFLASDSLGIKDYGFFLGREYRHKNINLVKKETIGYFPLLDEYKISIQESISWLNKLKKNHKQWIILPNPSIKELYPNMNRKDGDWTNEKLKLADEIKEITHIWNISFNKRCILLDKGISTWDDPILLSNIYDYKVRENKRKYIQEKIIHINSQENINIEPRKIKKYDFVQIIKNQENSIILDIESVINIDGNNIDDENINLNDSMPKISIIGTIINKEKFIYKDFTIRYLTNEEEKKIIKYWLNYLNRKFKGSIKVYHWGNAEKVYLNYMKNKYPDLKYPNFVMIDILYYFKNEPITIKGCFGYGLKGIVKQLYSLKLIDNIWIDDTDGLDAIIEIIKTSELAKENNIPIKRYIEIKNIVYYNYMDCRVIIDILKLLRNMC